MLPGYKHVDGFGPDDDYESTDAGVVEEVDYVTLDLGTVEPTLVPSSSSYRLIGLDSPTPFLQLSGTMLKGQHASLLGTELLFAESTEEHADRGKRSLVHVANTERRIHFREVELRPKQPGVVPDAQSSSAAKTSNLAKKVNTQVNRVMGGTAGPSRRGRGGRKRGSTSAQSKGKDRAEGNVADAEQSVTQAEVSAVDAEMDTSEG